MVVTIIVLLILAAVAINLTIGENGIFTRAQESTKKWQEAEVNEIKELKNAENIIDNYPKDKNDEEIQVDDDEPGKLDGDGTESNPYKIRSIEDLVIFSENVSNGESFFEKYVELMSNLNFNSNNSYANANEIFRKSQSKGDINQDGKCENIKKELTTGRGFISIGTVDNPFRGYFDGNNKKIKNLYINVNENITNNIEAIGLFASNNGTINNLTVTGNISTKNSATNYIGGISGINTNKGKIENCQNESNINATLSMNSSCDVGGIVGTNGISSGSNQTYGLINTSCNKGNITVNGEFHSASIGGISGNLTYKSEIKNSYNLGNITNQCDAWYYMGGISGEDQQGKIENCYNMGNIEGKIRKGSIGGVCGFSTYTDFKNCYNSGNIKFEILDKTEINYQIAGFVGSLSGAECNRIYSVANISENSDIVYRGNVGQVIGELDDRYGRNKLIDVYYRSTSSLPGIGIDGDASVENNNVIDTNSLPRIIEVVNGDNCFIETELGYPILKWQTENVK